MRTPLVPWFTLLLLISFCVPLVGCASGTSRSAPATAFAWSIALHGGAGTIDPHAPPELRAQYVRSLDSALREGRDRLERGESALDVCEAVVRILEDDPLFNAGRGAAFNERGEHELDASIMDGATMRCGAVAGVRTVKNPISLARRVMEKTNHVLLAGPGAEEFADAMGVERVPNTYFDTEARRRVLEEVLREREEAEKASREGHRQSRAGSAQARFGTVGCVARDTHGDLAAATSTGGLTGKRYGRIGDSPIIGAGTYADATVAVSCTGTGEEFIRHAVASGVSARMRFAGMGVGAATRDLIFKVLRPDDGGLIAVDREGNLAAEFSSAGMYRGLADSRGRFEVLIFKE